MKAALMIEPTVGDKNAIEIWAAEEYRDGVSAGAAARQLCRSLGAYNEAPTLKRLLEDMLGDANERSLDYSLAIDAIRDLISVIDFMRAGDGSMPLLGQTKVAKAEAILLGRQHAQ